MCVSSLSLRVVFATVPIHHLLRFGPYALFAYESNIHYLVALEISIFLQKMWNLFDTILKMLVRVTWNILISAELEERHFEEKTCHLC
jgi:hypothetical protein